MAGDPVNINEFQEMARQALPKMYYDYYSGGAGDEHILKENVEAFQRIIFQPRILVDVSNVDVSSLILGYNVSAPIMVAPTGMHKLAHHEGEVATARAAAACNTIMVLSFGSSCTIEEVASSCNAIRFYQLYVYQRRDVSATLVQRAERNGFKAIVLTADTPKLGWRERDIRNKLVVPVSKNLKGLLSVEVNSYGSRKLDHTQLLIPIDCFVFDVRTRRRYLLIEVRSLYITDHGFFFELEGAAFHPQIMSGEGLMFSDLNLDKNASIFSSFKDIRWLKSITSLPILIKGVLTAEDARMAVDAGVAGVIVSNHGARQLDYAPASISVLEEVVKAVEGRIPVLLDGGVRRGTDVFKALALGAQAVMVGRPVIYGLAAKGEYGVKRVLEMLRDELELTMALNGCCCVKDITRSYVRTEGDRLRSLL